jgi:two-component system response regulator YesN
MNLLVVDNEYYIVKNIVSSINLDALGIQTVFSAYSSDQAKIIIEKNAVDILITDIEMPHGSGLELIEWIRQQALPIVPLILTGHQRFDYAQKAITMHCFSYILKPFKISMVERELKKAMKSLPAVQSESNNPQPDLSINGAQEMDDFVQKVRDYIRENIHMNPDYISYLFHTKFGQTLCSYIAAARIDQAKELLLHSSFSILEISERMGYSSTSYFYKQFKKITGLTPQQYRDQAPATPPSRNENP